MQTASFLAVLALVAQASAFVAPSAPVGVTQRSATIMSAVPESRREMIKTVLGTATAAIVAGAVTESASADGAVSLATIARAKGIYGGRILGLKDAVSKGDFDAVGAEKNAFVLYNSGAYKRGNVDDKANQAQATALTKEIMAAVSAKDKAALGKAYSAYVKLIDIDTKLYDPAGSQGISSDYDWKSRTNKGTIYQR
ncbi:unnamed protein product [Chrysoparadoxa australica]